MKRFNTTGTCIPDRHYMVDTSGKLDEIISLIDQEEYFTINRSRQYGKTTTLYILKQRLKGKHEIISISFEGVGDGPFKTDAGFAKSIVELVYEKLEFTNIGEEDRKKWNDASDFDAENAVKWLSRKITALCKKYDIVLTVDEMDKFSDNQVFLNFLGMLREKYLSRNAGEDFTFKSVILAGVYDVRNLKLKLRPDEEKKYNSPWNIAVDFDVDMSFHPGDIATMLQDYEEDAHTGMDIPAISEELYHYTSGYPYLVSWLCKWIEEKGRRDWSERAVKEAAKAFLKLRTPLMDDLIKNIEQYDGLKRLVYGLLFSDNEVSFNLLNPDISLGSIFGIICERNEKTELSNIIFEIALYDYFTSIRSLADWRDRSEKSQFIKEDGRLDIVRILDRFQAFMKSEYRKEDEKFLESQGRLLFLCFLKPVINGTGFYYVEPETRSSSRMDIVVTYLDEEFIIELKIWRGDMYRQDGIKQLNTYLDAREQKAGYLVSFSFLKDKEYTAGYVSDIGDDQVPGMGKKRIYEVVV